MSWTGRRGVQNQTPRRIFFEVGTTLWRFRRSSAEHGLNESPADAMDVIFVKVADGQLAPLEGFWALGAYLVVKNRVSKAVRK